MTFDLGVNKRLTPTCGTQAAGIPGPGGPTGGALPGTWRSVLPGDERGDK